MTQQTPALRGSGIQTLRHTHNLQFMVGSNTTLLNYEDINSCLGITQADSVQVDDTGDNSDGTNLTSGILPGRRKVWIKNLNATTVYIGPSGVTATNGYPLQQNEELKLDIIGFDSPFAITAADTININVLQLA